MVAEFYDCSIYESLYCVVVRKLQGRHAAVSYTDLLCLPGPAVITRRRERGHGYPRYVIVYEEEENEGMKRITHDTWGRQRTNKLRTACGFARENICEGKPAKCKQVSYLLSFKVFREVPSALLRKQILIQSKCSKFETSVTSLGRCCQRVSAEKGSPLYRKTKTSYNFIELRLAGVTIEVAGARPTAIPKRTSPLEVLNLIPAGGTPSPRQESKYAHTRQSRASNTTSKEGLSYINTSSQNKSPLSPPNRPPTRRKIFNNRVTGAASLNYSNIARAPVGDSAVRAPQG
ncbi:hypothetical protein EVAR_28800_1 [Eumeta japonica]|uniref:Uncharacterized protein n=1 Tax=Eumeta variegata TaxID=151549 RepID=A0A4C1VGX2_EUMVA|nr:hypothetical protein EVAR_28800_1 [Eumeta japonica]